MYDFNDFAKVIKKAAIEAVRASRPADIHYGTVISTSPLKIKVDQKLILTEKQLVLARDVTDYEIEMEPSLNGVPHYHLTETREGGANAAAYEEHDHEYRGRKKFLVYNALKMNEEVILIQMSGGQRYVVIDRIGKG